MSVLARPGEREYVALSTTRLRDGSLLNIIGVAPQSEAKTYENTFRRVRQSFADRRLTAESMRSFDRTTR